MYLTWKKTDLVDVRDQLPFMRHVRFLVVGSEFALDGEEKDLQIPLFLKPKKRNKKPHFLIEKTWLLIAS